MSKLLGNTLVSKSGTVQTDAALNGKKVLLYFSAHWCPPCRGFTPVLAAWYTGLQEDFDRKDFEVVFVSSDKTKGDFDGYYNEMPWLALPFEDRNTKNALSKKYKVQGIPTLVVLDSDLSLITSKGRDLVTETKSKPTFKFDDYRPKKFWDIVGNSPVVDKSGKSMDINDLKANDFIGVYFSAHWCPPCRGFTPQLVKTYNAVKSQGKSFEIVFASSDKSPDQFKQYLNEMPWKSFPFGDKRGKELSQMFEVQGIPRFVVLDKEGRVVRSDARSAVSADSNGTEFPWYEKAIIQLDDDSAEDLQENPSLVVFADAANKDDVDAVLVETATKFNDQKRAGEDTKLLFFNAGSHQIAEKLKSIAKLKAQSGLHMAIFDLQDGKVYEYEGGPVTSAAVAQFAGQFVEGSLQGRDL
jgi:nucleoredoxin